MRKIYTLVIMGFALINLNADAQMSPVWAQSFQLSQTPGYSNESKKIATDSNGNVYVLCDVTSEYDPAGNLSTTPQDYTMLLKYTSTGVLSAVRQIYVTEHFVNGFDHQGGFGLELDNNDNIYIGYNNYNSATDFNVSIAKYNTSLIRKWTHTFNPSSNDLGVDLKVSPTGIAYALVKSISQANTQYNLIKADSAIINSVTPLFSFANNTEIFKSLAVDNTNDAFVTGYQLTNGFQSIVSARVNSSGTIKWKRVYNGGSSNRDDVGNKIIRGANQEVYIVGTSDRGSPFGKDPVVLKYITGNGRLEWVTFLDHNLSTEAGITLENFTPGLLHVGSVSGTKVIIDRLDALRGTLTGSNIYNPVPGTSFLAVDSVSIVDIKSTPGKSVFITGNVFARNNNNQNFSAHYLTKFYPETGRFPLNQAFKIDFEMPIEGDFNKSRRVADLTINNTSGRCIFLTDFAQTHASHNNEAVVISAYDFPLPLRLNNSFSSTNKPFDLNVLPNPTQGLVRVESENLIRRITIFDITGKVIFISDQINSEFTELDLTTLSFGTYFMKVEGIDYASTYQTLIKN